ncbi:17518_t:CDS:2, partial [Funneliformis geosporum]
QVFYTDLYQSYIKKTKAAVCSDCLDKRISFYQELSKKQDVVKRVEERIVSQKTQRKQSVEQSKERKEKVKKILEIKPDASPRIVEEMVKNNEELRKINPEVAGDIVEDVKKTVENIAECKKCNKKIGKSYSLNDEGGYICDDCYTSEPDKWCGCGREMIEVQETYECYKRGDYQCPHCEVTIEKYIKYSLRDGYKMKLPERTLEQIAKLEQD